ncbi:MAG TPA: DUF2953 domain-containing protein [Thermoclostridium sp.]
MYLPVILFFIAVFVSVLFMSLRISIEVIAENSGVTYSVKGIILKYIKIAEVKSGTEKPKKPQKAEKEREKILGIIKTAMKKNNGKIFHIEKLSLTGTFSVDDAAANAILYGFFIILWQFIIIFLSAHFTFEHQNYGLYPDFQNDKNELIFQVILRVVILKALLLVLTYYFESKVKNKRKAE